MLDDATVSRLAWCWDEGWNRGDLDTIMAPFAAEPELREEAVRAVAEASGRRGWGARAVTVSPLPGPSGNVEYFLWLRRGPSQLAPGAIDAEVARSASLSGAGERVEK